MVKHTQTIRRQQSTNCLSMFDNFMRLALKGLVSINQSDYLEFIIVMISIAHNAQDIYVTWYSKMGQVKFVEDSL